MCSVKPSQAAGFCLMHASSAYAVALGVSMGQLEYMLDVKKLSLTAGTCAVLSTCCHC
jgi:hypothetical protein